MYKLVVFCAFVAAAAAEPGALIGAPITQYSTFVAPATTTISKYDNSVIHPTPFNYYSASPLVYSHFIKKRSPQLPLGYYGASSYVSPSSYLAPSPYIASNPYVASAPLYSGASILPAIGPISPALHLIKKRSAPLLPSSYYGPQLYSSASFPYYSSPYASTGPLISQPLISQPLAYTHLIKKRSAPLLNTYLSPAAYSHQSRFDFQTSHTPLTSISYSAPITYSSPLAYSHVY